MEDFVSLPWLVFHWCCINIGCRSKRPTIEPFLVASVHYIIHTSICLLPLLFCYPSFLSPLLYQWLISLLRSSSYHRTKRKRWPMTFSCNLSLFSLSSPWGLKESDTTERLSTRTCEGRGEESGCSRVKWNIITGTLVHLLLITTDRPRSWCGTCLKTAHTSSLEQPMFHARIMSCVRESGLFFKTSLLPKWHITTNV